MQDNEKRFALLLGDAALSVGMRRSRLRETRKMGFGFTYANAVGRGQGHSWRGL
jgi:hypothetical protein